MQSSTEVNTVARDRRTHIEAGRSRYEKPSWRENEKTRD